MCFTYTTKGKEPLKSYTQRTSPTGFRRWLRSSRREGFNDSGKSLSGKRSNKEAKSWAAGRLHIPQE